MSVVTIISIAIMIVGIIGMIHPLFPGTLLVFAGPLIYVIFNGFSQISVMAFVIIVILTVIGLFVDNIASVLGTKKFGASRQALIGAVVGGIMGLLVFNIPGFIIGQFAGVIITEIYYGKELKKSIKAGLGVFIGYLAGYIIKLVLGGLTLLLFVFKVL